MENRDKWRRWLLLACAGLLILICLSILARFFLMQVAVKKLHYEGAWLETVLGSVYVDYRKSREDNPEKLDTVRIDWAAQYPFSDTTGENRSLTERYEHAKRQIQKAEKKMTEWSADHLRCYMPLVALGRKYQDLIDWHITAISAYNNVAEIGDGYLTRFTKRADQTERIESIAELSTFCHVQGIPLLYIAAPGKIARGDRTYAGKFDFSNENADEFLAGLVAHQIPYIDLRDNIERDGLDQRALFFKTDHHWLPETARWAAQAAAETLKAEGLLACNPALLTDKRFERKVYHDIFLGSHGKKITLAKAQPEDITQFLPLFPTQFQLHVPSMGIEHEGDFSILYNQKELQYGDYYHTNAYGAYAYGDRPYVSIRNELTDNEQHVLLIHDSFGDAFAPFLALEVRQLDLLDLRHFTGSVQSFIAQHQPDVVLVLYYNAEYANDIDRSQHKDLFDFR